MPYTVTGYDSAGQLRQAVWHDDDQLTGDGLLTGWLADNPYDPPGPPEGTTPRQPGTPRPAAEVEALRQHVSKLLTNVQIAPEPEALEGEAAQPAETPTAVADTPAPYTAAELEDLTVTDLRELATASQIAGASSMTKAHLVAALLAQQGS